MNTINPSQLPQISWQNQNVITTELLAQCYETDSVRIRQNYSKNQSRFIEGKHFFKLEGEALKNLQVANSDSQISSKARSLILWTEKGAARHSKILDSDKSWDMFDQLEEAYFHPERRMAQPALPPPDYTALQSKYIALLEQENSRLKTAPAPLSAQFPFGMRRFWTPEEWNTAQTMKAKGYGCTRIGKQLGRTKNSVQHHFRYMAKRQGGAA